MTNPNLIGVLCEWGRYIRSADNPGIGYPRQCSYTKLVQDHSRGVTVLPDDVDDNELITRIIWNMADAEPLKGAVLIAEYKHGGSLRERVRRWHKVAKEYHDKRPRRGEFKKLSRWQYARYLVAAHNEIAVDLLLADMLIGQEC